MTTRHLIADLKLPLNGDVDLDHLDHARGQFIPLLDLLNLLFRHEPDQVDLVPKVVQGLTQQGVLLGILEAQLLPVDIIKSIHKLMIEYGTLFSNDLAAVFGAKICGNRVTDGNPSHFTYCRVLDDINPVAFVLAQLQNIGLFNLQRPDVLLGTGTSKDLGTNDGPHNTWRHAQGCIADVTGLLTENSPQQLLFRSELRLALGRDLTDQDVVRLHFSTDTDNAGLVEVAQGFLADVGNVASDLFLAELRIARDTLKFLNVNRGKLVVLDDLLGDED